VFATIQAHNVKGDSIVSIEGNGAVILRVPDKPINLVNVPASTSGSTIGLSWENGANDGGSPVVDYMIVYSYNSVAYATLETFVSDSNFIVNNLTPGITYKFKVASRNIFGYSDFSDETQILAA
jgi:hypothetical protein